MLFKAVKARILRLLHLLTLSDLLSLLRRFRAGVDVFLSGNGSIWVVNNVGISKTSLAMDAGVGSTIATNFTVINATVCMTAALILTSCTVRPGLLLLAPIVPAFLDLIMDTEKQA